MKHVLIAMLVAATATLVGVLAFRLSVDALALIVGVLLGMAAMVPTVVIGGLVLCRSLEKKDTERYSSHMTTQPPVIVVSGGMPSTWLPPVQQQQATPQALMSQSSPAPRRFQVLGFEEESEIEQDALI